MKLLLRMNVDHADGAKWLVVYTRKQMPLFWTKWLENIRETQREDGSLSDWAPELPESNRKHDAAKAGNYAPLVWYRSPKTGSSPAVGWETTCCPEPPRGKRCTPSGSHGEKTGRGTVVAKRTSPTA